MLVLPGEFSHESFRPRYSLQGSQLYLSEDTVVNQLDRILDNVAFSVFSRSMAHSNDKTLPSGESFTPKPRGATRPTPRPRLLPIQVSSVSCPSARIDSPIGTRHSAVVSCMCRIPELSDKLHRLGSPPCEACIIVGAIAADLAVMAAVSQMTASAPFEARNRGSGGGRKEQT